MGYLESADQVGAWLLHAAHRQPEGWTWPVRPTVGRESGTGIWGGMAGPTLFFVEAYRTTGEEKWLEAARHGSRWMESHLDDALAGWAGCGLFTGVGGWAHELSVLARASDDDAADRQAARVLEAIMAAADVEDGRVSWHGLSEILWGTSGIGCLLLSLGRGRVGDRERVGDRALELAAGAGDWLIDYAEEAPPGIRWGSAPPTTGISPGAPPRASRTSPTAPPASPSSSPDWLPPPTM
jgi:lantibiotic modifying enzyme